MSTFSTVLNGQLIPVAPSNAVFVPPAPAPLISQGSAPSTLPGAVAGAAVQTATPTASTAAGGSTTEAASSGGTVSGLVGNVWSLPAWQNPLVLVLVFLVFAYIILRAVHWSG